MVGEPSRLTEPFGRRMWPVHHRQVVGVAISEKTLVTIRMIRAGSRFQSYAPWAVSATAPRLREEMDALVGSGVCAVTVDLVLLEFIDSTSLSVLVTSLKRMRQDGGDLALRSLSPSILKVFEIAGLTEVFAIS